MSLSSSRSLAAGQGAEINLVKDRFPLTKISMGSDPEWKPGFKEQNMMITSQSCPYLSFWDRANTPELKQRWDLPFGNRVNRLSSWQGWFIMSPG